MPARRVVNGDEHDITEEQLAQAIRMAHEPVNEPDDDPHGYHRYLVLGDSLLQELAYRGYVVVRSKSWNHLGGLLEKLEGWGE